MTLVSSSNTTSFIQFLPLENIKSLTALPTRSFVCCKSGLNVVDVDVGLQIFKNRWVIVGSDDPGIRYTQRWNQLSENETHKPSARTKLDNPIMCCKRKICETKSFWSRAQHVGKDDGSTPTLKAHIFKVRVIRSRESVVQLH
ncbi:hypothetical protein HG531_006721 [Fusarium graminearum]|nr:hypothetical protein HG531_006721 [Fusarium graminearum]